MKNYTLANLKTYAVEPDGAPQSLVILLHGYGADGRDLISIGEEWQTNLPNTVFVSPDAPYPCEMSPLGRQWFSLSEYTIPAMEREIISVWPTLDKYLNALLEHYNLTDDKMIISGFSQGCMMSLYALPRRAKPCAGILGYSGRLLGESALEESKNSITPVHLIHGEADNVVPCESWDHATQTLEEQGYSVTGHTTPRLAHGIDMEGIRSGLGFIQNCFK